MPASCQKLNLESHSKINLHESFLKEEWSHFSTQWADGFKLPKTTPTFVPSLEPLNLVSFHIWKCQGLMTSQNLTSYNLLRRTKNKVITGQMNFLLPIELTLQMFTGVYRVFNRFFCNICKDYLIISWAIVIILT